MSDSSSQGQPYNKPASRLFGHYLIKHHFQFKFSLILFSLLAASTLILWLESRMVVKHLIETGVVTSEEAIEQVQILSQVIGKTGFIILAFNFGFTLFLSHFVAGPMYRFERTFEEMKKGNLSMMIKLRKHDQFQEVAEALNFALSGLRSKIKEERDFADTVIGKSLKIAETLKQSGHTAEADQIVQLMNDLKTKSRLIKTS